MRDLRGFAGSIVWLCVAITPLSSIAADYEAQIRAGIGVSDNIARTSAAEIDESIATAGADFAVVHESSKVFLDLRSNFDYLDYLDDSFDSEWIGGAYGTLIYTLAEERFTWTVQDNFGQQLFDPFEPARPDNRENVNFFTTGPTFTLRAGQRNPFVIDVRYSALTYEDRPVDNDRLSGNLSLGRDLNRTSTVSLNLGGERIEFDDPGASAPIERYDAFVRYEKTGSRNTFSIDLGYNEVEVSAVESSGVLVELNFTRQTSPRGILTMNAGSRFSDSGNVFRFYQDITDDLRTTVDGAASDAPFQNDFIAVNYSLQHSRYSITASTDWNVEDYNGGLGVDREVYRAELALERRLTRKFFAGTNFAFLRREFDLADRRDDDFLLGLNAGFQVTPGFAVALEYHHFRRDGTAVGQDYTENRAFLRFSYTPRWGRQTELGAQADPL